MLAFVTAAPPAPHHRLHVAVRPAVSPPRPRVCAAADGPPPTPPPPSPDRSSEFNLSPRARANPSDPAPAPAPAPGSPAASGWAAWAQPKSAPPRPHDVRTIPALPFRPADVFLPGESKTLHLFEARYLALFEAALARHDAHCVHVLIDSSRGAMAAHAVLLRLRDWRRLGVGVAVTAHAVARVRATAFRPSPTPFLEADFEPVVDAPAPPARGGDLADLEHRFWAAFERVAAGARRLDVPVRREKTDLAGVTIAAAEGRAVDTSPSALEARVSAAAKRRAAGPRDADADAWTTVRVVARRAAGGAELDFGDNADDEMVQRRAAALSFAGWEFFQSTPGMRQKALEGRCTVSRMQAVVDGLEERARQLAAQIAVKDALQ